MLVVAAACAVAARADGKTDGVTSFPSGQVAVSENYYKQFSFDWTDSEGNVHTSNLTDKATEVEHMIALLDYVYRTPAIPGFVHDLAYDRMIADGFGTDGINEEDSRKNLREVWANVPYLPCPESPFNMDPSEIIETPLNGATALLVELKDSFEKLPDANYSDEVIKDYVKSVSLITKQIYVSTSQDGAENPGYLFNVEGKLNKFFIVTKGRNRATYVLDENGRFKEGVIGTRPFYNMFEEFSPSNKEPIYGVYEKMNNEEAFHVDHNCSSVIKQAHHIGLDIQRENPEDYVDYTVNLMFFLPDYRFLGDSRRNGPNNSWEHYTYYPSSYNGEETLIRRPFMFFNKIKATIAAPEVNSLNHMVKVPVSWRSEYKDITRSQVPEQFFVYRVVDGVIETEPIPGSQLEMRQADTALDPVTGEIVRTNSPEVEIYVYETQKEESRNVRYVIRGRRSGSEFSYVESNQVQEMIPGYSRFETLKINIDGTARSQFDVAAQKNVYANTVDLLNNASEENCLRYCHLKAPAGAEDEGTVFELRRYTGDDADYDVVGHLTITSKSVSADGLFYLFDYKVTYADGRKDESKLIHRFRTPRNASNPESDALARVEAVEGNEGILATFVDRFSADVAQNKQPGRYSYQIVYQSEVKLDDNSDDRTAFSNRIDVNVPVRNLYVGFEPYSLEEIMADTDHDNLLPENPRAIFFEARNNVDIKSYEVLHIPAGSSEGFVVGKAERNPSGAYLRFVYDSSAASGAKAPAFKHLGSTANAFEGTIHLPLEKKMTPQDKLVLVIRFQNDNTYGHHRLPLSELPRVDFTDFDFKYYGDGSSHNYRMSLFWEPGNLEINETDFWTPAAYRLWANNESYGGMKVQHSSVEDIAPSRSSRVSSNNPSEEAANTEHYYDFSLDHAPSEDNVAWADHRLRMYARVPERYLASDKGLGEGYVVADAYNFTRLLDAQKPPVLGVDTPGDDIDENIPAVLYDLSGRRASDNPAPGVYLEVRGDRVRKVFVK